MHRFEVFTVTQRSAPQLSVLTRPEHMAAALLRCFPPVQLYPYIYRKITWSVQRAEQYQRDLLRIRKELLR